MKEDRYELEERILARREIDPATDCWLFTGATTRNGYGAVWVSGEVRYAHRLSAVLYLDLDTSTGLYVLHRCDRRACFNPDHLWLGTQTDNMRDASLKGRTAKKLNAEQVAEIKYRLSAKETQKSIALAFSVTTSTIGQIARGETWKHVPTPASDPSDTN